MSVGEGFALKRVLVSGYHLFITILAISHTALMKYLIIIELKIESIISWHLKNFIAKCHSMVNKHHSRGCGGSAFEIILSYLQMLLGTV